jgi:hypothetical protein
MDDATDEKLAYLEKLIDELTPDRPSPMQLTPDEQRYLEQLNMEILYAQKAYFGFLSFLRRIYDAPDGQWAMNNVNVGFERIGNHTDKG